MPSVTVATLITRAAAAADMENNFVTPAQWIAWANTENKMLAVKLARLGYPFYQSDESLTMTGALQYTLTEPLSVLAVFWVEPDGAYRKLESQNPFTNQGLASRTSGEPWEYNVSRNSAGSLNFSFYPNPASGTVIVRIVPHPNEIDATTDAVNYPLNWEERIVLGMAQRALAKEETYNPLIERQIAEMDAHIEAAVWDYLMSDAPVVRDARQSKRATRWLGY